MEFLSFENCFCKSAIISQMNLLSLSSSNGSLMGSLLGSFRLRHSCGSAQDSITTVVTKCLWLLIEMMPGGSLLLLHGKWRHKRQEMKETGEKVVKEACGGFWRSFNSVQFSLLSPTVFLSPCVTQDVISSRSVSSL